MKLDFYADEWSDFEKHCGFTDDELKVVGLLRRGWRLIDIAAEMYVSESTVKRRKASIERKILHYIICVKR